MDAEEEHVKVLIVDDDPIIITELKEVIAGMGEVYTASSGQSAVATAKDVIPDIILLDIGLPDIDGFNVLKEIYEDPELNTVNVIVITSHDDFDTQLKSLSEGATDCIAKPVNGILLQKKIRNIYNLSQTIEAKVCIEKKGDIQSLEVRFKNLLSMLSEAVIITDDRGNIQICNDYCTQLFGYPASDLVGQSLRVLIPELGAEFSNTNSKTLGIPRESKAISKDSRLINVELNLSHFDDPQGGHYLALVRDVSEKKRIQARLLKAAMYDSLTGVYSREALDVDSEKLRTQFEGQYFLAGLLDVDRFRELNAIFGHARSNKLLQSLATKLRMALKEMPVRVYRVGGDVFVIKSYRSMSEHEYLIYQSLLSECVMALKEQLSRELNHRVSISAVASIFDIDILKNGSLVPMLEDALRVSHQSGQSGELNFVTHSTYGRTVQLAELSQTLVNDVDLSKLDVVFQPKVTTGGQIHSAEALLRWHDDTFHPLTLADYIEAAESTGAIVDVGYYVIDRVCKAINELTLSGCDIGFSINLSLRQFSDTRLMQHIVEICRKNRVDTRKITFEITETVIAKNVGALTTALNLLKEQGFSISIDDFGTGQSNMRYIHKLPIDEIKIDKSFIDDIDDTSSSYPVIDSIISMAQAMDLQLVAEGVETQTQLDYMRAKACDLIQGFYFFKPMPQQQLLDALEQQVAVMP